MSFYLSNRSQERLIGVHPVLCEIVTKAIKITKVDFGVICGVRSIEEQRQMVASGASKTMNSKHLIQDTGYSHAVDLMAYLGSRGSWELSLYDEIADAIKEVAEKMRCPIRWGAAWSIPDIRQWDGTMEEAMMSYVDLRRSQDKRPFIDGPHFEMMV